VSVSIALIVRNEEQTLRRCLGSIRRAVDEIVVVDTGSTDGTREVAAGFTDRIYEYAWHDDFAAARQFAFDRASGDWVGWLDADDVVLNAAAIRGLAAHAGPDIGVIHWRYVVDRDTWGNSRSEYWRERLVRNDGSFHWRGRVHEVLESDRPWASLRAPEVVVEHRPLPGHRAGRVRRNLDILEAEYAERESSSPPRLLYYLAREHAEAGNLDDAIRFYHRYLRIAGRNDESYLARIQLADVNRRAGRYNQAINTCLLALKVCPHWPDAYFGLAQTFYFLRDWHAVIHWTEVGRAMPRPDTLQIINPLDYSFNWIIYFSNALFHINEVAEGVEWTRRALEICPDDPWHVENLRIYSGVPGSTPHNTVIETHSEHAQHPEWVEVADG
jgi:glycosyltransferase involved in cell wall biosynthesis